MGESTKVDLTVTGETVLDWRRQEYAVGTDQPTDQATFTGVTSVGATVYSPTIKNEVDLSASLKFLGGGSTLSDTPITRSSRLFGHFTRLDYALSRADIYKDHFGVYEAYLTANFKTPGLTVFGGIFPQDSKVYPNHLNTASCTVRGVTIPCYISQGNAPDNTIWTDLFTAHIGPGAGAAWKPSFIKGLELSLIASTGIPPINAASDDPDIPFGKRWITTPQALWSSEEYEVRGLPSSTLLAAFHSHDVPASSQNDKGETVSPTDCFGFYLRQVFGPLQIAGGYGLNTNKIMGQDVAIENLTQSVNLGLRYSLWHDRLFINGTVSWIGFSTREKSSIVENEARGNEYAVEGSATVAVIKGLALSAGGRVFIADSNAQAVVGGARLHSSLYASATYTYIFSWGGGGK